MKRFLRFALFAVVVVFAFKGCIFDPDKGKPDDDTPEYKPPTSPENIVINLEASYERREIEEYAKLLDPQFIFKFQEADIPPGLEREYWNRDEDSTGTYALFSTNEVSSISLDPGVYSVQDAGRIDEPGAKRIRLTQVKLEVNTVDGTTLLVQGDIQDMYFRRGTAEAGTDSTRWYLFEWQDQSGGGGAPGRGVTPVASDSPGGVQEANWGAILADFSRKR